MKRKMYVSYVIQTKDSHSHHSEIIEVEAPYYKFSFAPDETTTNAIMKWKEEKGKNISLKNEQLVLTNYFLFY